MLIIINPGCSSFVSSIYQLKSLSQNSWINILTAISPLIIITTIIITIIITTIITTIIIIIIIIINIIIYEITGSQS